MESGEPWGHGPEVKSSVNGKSFNCPLGLLKQLRRPLFIFWSRSEDGDETGCFAEFAEWLDLRVW